MGIDGGGHRNDDHPTARQVAGIVGKMIRAARSGSASISSVRSTPDRSSWIRVLFDRSRPRRNAPIGAPPAAAPRIRGPPRQLFLPAIQGLEPNHLRTSQPSLRQPPGRAPGKSRAGRREVAYCGHNRFAYHESSPSPHRAHICRRALRRALFQKRLALPDR